MGMYTELLIKAEIKSDTPKYIVDELNTIFNRHISNGVGTSCSYYHIPWFDSKFEDGYIFSRSDLKNYGGEIEEFVAWLKPHLNFENYECFGWVWYEEESVPTLLMK